MIRIEGNTRSRALQHQLQGWGFRCISNKSTGARSWVRDSEKGWRRIRRWCTSHHLRFQKIDQRYSRSSSYRQTFLAANKGLHHQGRIYRCAYCGRRVRVQNMEVDHLISCKAAGNSRISKLALKMIGAGSVNDVRNLVAACRECNRKKGAQQGLWVIRGLVGRHAGFWMAWRAALVAFVLLGILSFCTFYGPSLMKMISG